MWFRAGKKIYCGQRKCLNLHYSSVINRRTAAKSYVNAWLTYNKRLCGKWRHYTKVSNSLTRCSKLSHYLKCVSTSSKFKHAHVVRVDLNIKTCITVVFFDWANAFDVLNNSLGKGNIIYISLEVALALFKLYIFQFQLQKIIYNEVS